MGKFCSSCGSPVTGNEKFCHSCGEELASIETQPANRSEIIDSLEKAKAYFAVKQNDYNRVNQIQAEYDSDNGIVCASKIAKYGVIGLVISGALAFFNIIAELDFLLLLSLIAGGLFCLMIFVSIVLAVYDASTGKKRFADYQSKRTQQENEINELHNSLVAYYNVYSDCPVSFEYSNPAEIERIYAMISSGRADSVKEAIQCLIDDAHREQVIALQAETAKNAKQAADSARRASVISTANYIKK